MNEAEFEAASRAILNGVTSLTLATVDETGRPWTAPVYFVAIEWSLYFLSSPKSRHCLNLSSTPSVAASLHPEVPDWREIRGLQMEGVAGQVVEELEHARALSAYLARFPFAAGLIQPKPGVSETFSTAVLYQFTAERVLYLDNRLGPGLRHEVWIEDQNIAKGPIPFKNP
jgi:uncharacterized protein YhbP (UPF0306 family)